MYSQKKDYVVFIKNGEKPVNAGLRKITTTDKKIRAEFFLNPLPLYYGESMECVLSYRNKDGAAVTKSWKATLELHNSHYMFSVQTPEYIEKIDDCRILLQGKGMIVSDKDVLSAELPAKERESAENIRKIEYIRDLDYLRAGDEEMKKLYYNSFLLHGFYQYRYFVVGNDFIGVPDHFYEREAIAAKMMGFPYFMEAEFVESCTLGEGSRDSIPKQGSFGYYLRKIRSRS